MRHGIEILRNAGLYADKDGVKQLTLDIINKASKRGYSRHREVIETLQEQELLTYYSFLIKLNNEEFVLIKDAYHLYNSICKQFNIRPHVIMSFRKYIRRLENYKLLISNWEYLKRGRRKRFFSTNDNLKGITKEIKLFLDK